MSAALLALILAAPAPAATGAGCGYTPTWRPPTPTEAVYRDSVGCGLAPATPDAWKTVVQIEVARIQTGPKRTQIEVVFLDAQGRRVRPIGRSLRYEMQFTRKHAGTLPLRADAHRDGIFQLDLPPDTRTGRCDVHLLLYFDTGRGGPPLRHWLDDWLLLC